MHTENCTNLLIFLNIKTQFTQKATLLWNLKTLVRPIIGLLRRVSFRIDPGRLVFVPDLEADHVHPEPLPQLCRTALVGNKLM